MNSRLLACLFLSVILASCGGPSSNKKKDAPLGGAATATPGLCDSFDLAQFAMDTARAAQIADSFLQFYRHDDAAGTFSADATGISIPKDLMLAFEGLAPELDPSMQCLGVRIAYGLDESARPAFLFSPVVMTRTASAAGTLSFELGEATAWFSPVSGSWQQWTDDEAASAMQRYASRVLKYVDGDLRSLDIDPAAGSASDPSSTLFPFTEFRELIRENEEAVTEAYKDREEIPSITAVRVTWAAEKLGSNGTMKHVVVMIPVLNGPDYPGPDLPLTMKAANFNTLCPPSCAGSVVSYRSISGR